MSCALQLLSLRDKTLDEVAKQLTVWRPNLVYFSCGASPITEANHRTLTDLRFKAGDGVHFSFAIFKEMPHYLSSLMLHCVCACSFVHRNDRCLCATGTEVPVGPHDLAAILDGQEIDAVYLDGFATAKHGMAHSKRAWHASIFAVQ